jgi:hypothetical protein
VRRDDPADAASVAVSESVKKQQQQSAQTAAPAIADKQLTYEEFCALVQHRAHTVRVTSRADLHVKAVQINLSSESAVGTAVLQHIFELVLLTVVRLNKHCKYHINCLLLDCMHTIHVKCPNVCIGKASTEVASITFSRCE